MRNDVQRRKLNLTQLRKNKRKRPDKTSGRKRPRTAYVDVVAAPDADPSVASAATGHVDDDVEPDDDPDDAVVIRDDICHACSQKQKDRPTPDRLAAMRQVPTLVSYCMRWCSQHCC